MRLGLVLEGGANRTAFSCGVLDALSDLGIMADYVGGVSAGISYAISYIAGQRGRNYEIYTHYINDERYMGMDQMINPLNKSYFNLDFVYDKIPNELVPFDYDAYDAWKGTAEATATNIETGKADYLPIPHLDKKMSALRATCALPILFPPIEYQGKKYMDGGIADPIPFARAQEMGCDHLIIVATRERGYVKKPEALLTAATIQYRNYPQFTKALRQRADVYNDERKAMFALEKEGRAFVLLPYSTEGFSRTERDVNKIKALYQSGYDQLIARHAALTAYLRS